MYVDELTLTCYLYYEKKDKTFLLTDKINTWTGLIFANEEIMILMDKLLWIGKVGKFCEVNFREWATLDFSD